MPARIAAQLERSFDDVAALDAYEAIRGGTVVARGINYGTAFEIALKIRELSGPALRGVVVGRPDARAGRRDRARAGR